MDGTTYRSHEDGENARKDGTQGCVASDGGGSIHLECIDEIVQCALEDGEEAETDEYGA